MAARLSITGFMFAIVVAVLPVSVPVSSSVRVMLIVYSSDAVPVGLSSRYRCVSLKDVVPAA